MLDRVTSYNTVCKPYRQVVNILIHGLDQLDQRHQRVCFDAVLVMLAV